MPRPPRKILSDAAGLLSEARVLMGGDAAEKTRGRAMLDTIVQDHSYETEAQDARNILAQDVRVSAWSFEDPALVSELRMAWTAAGHDLRHPSLPALVKRLFDPDTAAGPRLRQLREEVIDFLTTCLSRPADLQPELLERLQSLLADIAGHPEYKVSTDTLLARAEREIFERGFQTLRRDITAALAAWEPERAREILSGIAKFPDGLAKERTALSQAINDTAGRMDAFRQVLQRLKEPKIGGFNDALLLANESEDLQRRAEALSPPPEWGKRAADAAAAVDRTLAAWLQDESGRCATAEDLTRFAAEFAKFPEHWRRLDNAAWFSVAWAGAKQALWNELATIARPDAVVALGERCERWARALPASLRPEAAEMAATLNRFGHAWKRAEAGDGAAPADVELPVAFPPKYLAALEHAQDIAARIEMWRRALLDHAKGNTAGELDQIQHAIDQLPMTVRTTGIGGQLAGLLARARGRLALGAALSSGDAKQVVRELAVPREAQNATVRILQRLFTLIGRVSRARTLDSQLGWWEDWSTGIAGLLELKVDVPGLESRLLDAWREAVSQLRENVDALVTDPGRSAAQLRAAAARFGPMAGHLPLRLAQERIAAEASRRDFEAAASAADWDRADLAVSGLEGLLYPPDWTPVLHLRSLLGRATSERRLAAAVSDNWADISQKLPRQAPELVLQALREVHG